MMIGLALASCGGDRPDPVSPSPSPALGPVASVPPGWVAIAPPDDERLHCANYAHDEWQVAIAANNTATFTESPDHDADTGPALPFAPSTPDREVRGRRHVLAVPDGYLVGFDAGEWGGALYWFSPNGARTTKLADDNVHGLVAVGPNLVASIEGLDHSVHRRGQRPLDRARGEHVARRRADRARRRPAHVRRDDRRDLRADPRVAPPRRQGSEGRRDPADANRAALSGLDGDRCGGCAVGRYAPVRPAHDARRGTDDEPPLRRDLARPHVVRARRRPRTRLHLRTVSRPREGGFTVTTRAGRVHPATPCGSSCFRCSPPAQAPGVSTRR